MIPLSNLSPLFILLGVLSVVCGACSRAIIAIGGTNKGLGLKASSSLLISLFNHIFSISCFVIE